MKIGNIIINSDGIINSKLYSLPILQSGISVLGRREEKINMWNFFDSLDLTIWFLLLVTAFLVGTCCWIFED